VLVACRVLAVAGATPGGGSAPNLATPVAITRTMLTPLWNSQGRACWEPSVQVDAADSDQDQDEDLVDDDDDRPAEQPVTPTSGG
jgi:hypothetical protein